MRRPNLCRATVSNEFVAERLPILILMLDPWVSRCYVVLNIAFMGLPWIGRLAVQALSIPPWRTGILSISFASSPRTSGNHPRRRSCSWQGASSSRRVRTGLGVSPLEFAFHFALQSELPSSLRAGSDASGNRDVLSICAGKPRPAMRHRKSTRKHGGSECRGQDGV
jgi:hypothetical protein